MVLISDKLSKPDLVPCEAGDSIKPGALAPGKEGLKDCEPVKTGDSGVDRRSVFKQCAFARSRGLERLPNF